MPCPAGVELPYLSGVGCASRPSDPNARSFSVLCEAAADDRLLSRVIGRDKEERAIFFTLWPLMKIILSVMVTG